MIRVIPTTVAVAGILVPPPPPFTVAVVAAAAAAWGPPPWVSMCFNMEPRRPSARALSGYVFPSARTTDSLTRPFSVLSRCETIEFTLSFPPSGAHFTSLLPLNERTNERTWTGVYESAVKLHKMNNGT